MYIDAPRYTKTLDQAIQVQVRQAAREWLRAVILKVPVWTGTSVGSLQPLGNFLRVKVPNNPVAVRPGYGPSVGRANQEFKFERNGTTWSFSFTEGVAHYIVNEFYNVNDTGHFNLKNPGPYLSFKAGEIAFQSYIQKYLLQRVPNLKDFIYNKQLNTY